MPKVDACEVFDALDEEGVGDLALVNGKEVIVHFTENFVDLLNGGSSNPTVVSHEVSLGNTPLDAAVFVDNRHFLVKEIEPRSGLVRLILEEVEV